MRTPLSTLLFIALLPATASADLLRSPEQLRQLCEAGQAFASDEFWPAAPLSEAGQPQNWAALVQLRNQARERARVGLQAHETVIAPSDFQFLPFADDIEHLVVSTVAGLPLVGGVATLELDDTSIGFVMDESSAADIVAAHRLGGVALRLVFDVSPVAGEGRERTICEAGEAGGPPRLHGRLLAASLFDPLSDALLATVETPHGTAERARRGGQLSGSALAAAPRAEVTGLEVDGGSPFPESEANFLRAAVEERLTGCYARALTQNGGLKGALVLGLQLGDAGEMEQVDPRIDVLGDASVKACSLSRLGALLIPRAVRSQPLKLRATVVFRPE